MAGAFASGLIQPQISTRIPLNTSFIWLNAGSEDFEQCTQYLYKQTSFPPHDWKFYNNKDECSRHIRQELTQQIILVSSGRLGADVVSDLHDLLQIHSIYIYCNKKGRYAFLKNDYKKVRGIFDDPVQLLDQMCRDLDKEARQFQLNIAIANDTIPIPKSADIKIHCLFQNEIKSYYRPNISWCPWQTNSCTVSLPIKGQGTIELWLHESVSFELCISNKQNLNDNDTNSYAIVLKLDTREALLGTISARHGHILRVQDSTTELHQVVQVNNKYWHCYWLTFYGKDRLVQYGIGEIRPKFKILETQLQACDKIFIEGISYLHIKINNSTDINAMEHLKDKLRIFIGKEPVIFDPPLLIISPNEFSPTHPANNNGVLAHLLEDLCRNLYLRIINFTLNDDSFPNFIQTIEHSIRNPRGWCRQKLEEKANQFGKPKAEATYLCIIVNELESGMIKYPFVIKIWPPGHYSPIHNHNDAYGIIRVLYGKLLVKYFPGFSRYLCQKPLIEQLFEENQVTWLIPKLNQTHQLKNPYTWGSCCITIQCYQYETDDQVDCEHFGYITNDDHHIDYYNCVPDDDYLTFKKTMKMESTTETVV